MPTRRQERVNGRIVQEVSEALQNLKDPRLGMVTVTGCDVSPDLRNAKVLVSIFGDDEEKETSFAVIQRAAGHLQKIIGNRIEMKRTPRLYFTLDRGIEKIDTMSQLIAEARATDPNQVEGDQSDNSTSAADSVSE